MYNFTNDDIVKINDVLGCKAKHHDNSWTWNLKTPDNSKPMVFTVNSNIKITDNDLGNLISIQTIHGYYELHNITHYMFFEPDEVIFINEKDNLISCLIIGKQCTCSLYSNIMKETLNSDFTELDPAALLSAMQLSIIDTMFD